jgi:hypothetical protein
MGSVWESNPPQEFLKNLLQVQGELILKLVDLNNRLMAEIEKRPIHQQPYPLVPYSPNHGYNFPLGTSLPNLPQMNSSNPSAWTEELLLQAKEQMKNMMKYLEGNRKLLD